MSLLEDFALLGATAVITGIGVPLVKGHMDERRLAQQRLAEEQLTRDTKFIETQAQLLDELSSTLWDFAGLALAISYHRTYGSTEQGDQAWKIYDNRSFEMLTRFRSLVSRAQRLVTPETHAKLTHFFDWWFGEFDPQLSTLARGEADTRAWSAHHDRAQGELFTRTDAALDAVASDIGATRLQRAAA